MNFGWFDEFTSDTEFSRTTIHEFGHALGAIHEHQSPDANIPWDTEAVYDFYFSTQGWSRNEVDNNIFDRYDDSKVSNTDYDSASIMHYSIPNSLTIGDFSVGWNTVLSDRDKEFIGLIYPYYTFETDALRSNGSTQSDTKYNYADVNGDGKADKIYWNKGFAGGDVRVFLATSGGNFSSTATRSNGSKQSDTKYNYADVNGDGKADKIYWNKGFAGGDVRVFLATSGGNFSSTAIRSNGSTQSDTDYSYADVNGDGKADKIYWNKGFAGGDVRVFLATSGGNFSSTAIRSNGSTQYDTDYNYADVNGDGKADKIYWNKGHQGGEVRVFLATSGGNFSSTSIRSNGSTQYDTDYNYADVNGDGKADKIYWNKGHQGGDVRVFLSNFN